MITIIIINNEFLIYKYLLKKIMIDILECWKYIYKIYKVVLKYYQLANFSYKI